MTSLRFGLLYRAVALGHGEFAKEQDVMLLPAGETTLKDGSRILVDQEAGAAIEAARVAHGPDIPFDINHATVHKPQKGERADAYGWIDRFWYEEDRGLMGHVTWTEDGFELIGKGAYRYVSPAFGYDPKTGRVQMIHSAALCTKPATPQMPALAATELFPLDKETKVMDGLITKLLQDEAGAASADQLIGELKAALKGKGVELGDGADVIAILKAAITKIEGGDTAEPDTEEAAATLKVVRERLKLAADADSGAILKTLSDAVAHVGFTPNAEVTALTERLETLEGEDRKRRGAELREKYKTKLNPQDKEQWAWAVETSEKDPEHFEMMVKNAPERMPPQGKTAEPPAGQRRDTIITTATAEHRENPDGAVASLTDYVDGALREEGLALLTDDEKAKLAAA